MAANPRGARLVAVLGCSPVNPCCAYNPSDASLHGRAAALSVVVVNGSRGNVGRRAAADISVSGCGVCGLNPRRQCLTARCTCQGHAAEDPDNQCGCSCEAVQDPGAAVTGYTHSVCSKFDFVPSCCADARIENAIREYAAQATIAQVTEECQPSWEVTPFPCYDHASTLCWARQSHVSSGDGGDGRGLSSE